MNKSTHSEKVRNNVARNNGVRETIARDSF